eukprot:6182559-Pleurochrysis_carterae.AAC.3
MNAPGSNPKQFSNCFRRFQCSVFTWEEFSSSELSHPHLLQLARAFHVAAIVPGERDRLINALCAGDWALDENLSLAAENADLCECLESSTVDGKDIPVGGSTYDFDTNGCRSLHRVPILCAALTISKRDPGLKYEEFATRFSTTAFDNFSIGALGGMQTKNDPGSQINMTNWASLALPLSAVGDSLANRVARSLREGKSLSNEKKLKMSRRSQNEPIQGPLTSYLVTHLGRIILTSLCDIATKADRHARLADISVHTVLPVDTNECTKRAGKVGERANTA